MKFKEKTRMIFIIALAAVIGFSFISCKDNDIDKGMDLIVDPVKKKWQEPTATSYYMYFMI